MIKNKKSYDKNNKLINNTQIKYIPVNPEDLPNTKNNNYSNSEKDFSKNNFSNSQKNFLKNNFSNSNNNFINNKNDDFQYNKKFNYQRLAEKLRENEDEPTFGETTVEFEEDDNMKISCDTDFFEVNKGVLNNDFSGNNDFNRNSEFRNFQNQPVGNFFNN